MKQAFLKVIAILTLQILPAWGLQAAEIHDAASRGDLETVQRLLKLNPHSLQETDENGRSPLPNYEGKIIQTKIDIGGYALYVNIAGEGSPAVIFEAGGSHTSSIWELVQPEVSKMTRTFSYDRAGLGKSDKRNLPNTSLTQVQELHALLKKADVKGPYIFVANSYGAFIVKLFANLYPNKVSGVVFVDGTHEKLTEFLSNNLAPDQLEVLKKMMAANPDGNYEEMLISAEQVKEAGKKDELRKKPVVVLTSDIQIAEKQFAGTPMQIAFSQWMNWQKDLVALSDKSQQYIIEGSGHLIHSDKPQAVIDAIKKMIECNSQGR